MPIYRRKRGSDVWHWSPSCPHWPTSDFEEFVIRGRPPSGLLDKECQRAERNKQRRGGQGPALA
ncbi:MAG: hypothetical protein ACOCWR_04265 [Oceanidesulfovibrio sp.]